MNSKNIQFLLVTLLTALGLIHFYWASGGNWGLQNVLPTKTNGELVLDPTSLDSLIVGIELLLVALHYLSQLAKTFKVPFISSKFVSWLIPIIFLARAIGDFKYVGLFKSVIQTNFAYYDKLYFTPLCLVISTLGFIVAIKRSQKSKA